MEESGSLPLSAALGQEGERERSARERLSSALGSARPGGRERERSGVEESGSLLLSAAAAENEPEPASSGRSEGAGRTPVRVEDLEVAARLEILQLLPHVLPPDRVASNLVHARWDLAQHRRVGHRGQPQSREMDGAAPLGQRSRRVCAPCQPLRRTPPYRYLWLRAKTSLCRPVLHGPAAVCTLLDFGSFVGAESMARLRSLMMTFRPLCRRWRDPRRPSLRFLRPTCG